MGPYDQFRAAIRDSIEGMVFKGTTPDDAVTQAADDHHEGVAGLQLGRVLIGPRPR